MHGKLVSRLVMRSRNSIDVEYVVWVFLTLLGVSRNALWPRCDFSYSGKRLDSVQNVFLDP
jgi:hypothetical protein